MNIVIKEKTYMKERDEYYFVFDSVNSDLSEPFAALISREQVDNAVNEIDLLQAIVKTLDPSLPANRYD